LRSVERERSFILVTAATITPAPFDTDGKLGLAIVNGTAVRLFSAMRT
jgi:hypothetical protein